MSSFLGREMALGAVMLGNAVAPTRLETEVDLTGLGNDVSVVREISEIFLTLFCWEMRLALLSLEMLLLSLPFV
jgi:hypothetical protein